MLTLRKPQKIEEMNSLVAPYRYLLCVDLEATCNEVDRDGNGAGGFPAIPPTEMECIEFGAVLLDTQDNDRVIGDFCCFVKPILHTRLTPFCTALTTITQEDVDRASGYPEVAAELEAFLAPYRDKGVMWCSWGAYDLKQLIQDAARLDVTPMLDAVEHTNLKKWHWKAMKCRAMGLKEAVESLGLTWIGTHHRGIDDARNVASVWRALRLMHLKEEASNTLE